MAGSGLHAAADPTTEQVYIPGAGSSSWGSMMVHSFTTRLLSSGASYGSLSSGGPYNTFMWNEVRKTFIQYTGNVPTSYAFLEYSPSTSQWSKLITSGPTPPFRIRSCMVAAYSGTKMILFGGDDDATSSSANLFILDVRSMTWIEMACSIAGDNFIIWGECTTA
ncbi:hypothetical protein BGZ97_006278 [Linnemannia gamsii]|uniref:Galactose oxidase n=1 Tax=Linnemannia gamsii TaxID=64522 RepID=A0A9P6RGJ6_9FUNG|nr:hypothetical protein BGZ97_006278 [Linnemannia gamsii]